MTADRNSKALRTALGSLALGFGLVGLAATAQAHDWKRPRIIYGPSAVVVVPAQPVYYAPAPVVAAPVVYAPAPVMYAPAYAAPASLSIGLNVPLR